MQTITFYSYNGGTGRTLALANAARYLVRLGQRVFAIDLDLEAPGLHYKLALGSEEDVPPITRGLVDYIHSFLITKQLPALADHTVQIRTEADREEYITLMPAGNVPRAEYWHKLTQIDWHNLFYSANPEGIPFFLEMKARIEREFSPDFLLIDARTGITEIGGVATTILPDRVVCLLLNNKQNLDGSRAVLRGIAGTPRFHGKEPIGIIPVLARIPWTKRGHSPDLEEKAVEEVRAFLYGTSANGSALRSQDIVVLHSEDALQYNEALRVGGRRTVDESPLLRDYLRLFSTLIPSDMVEPRLERIISACMAEMIERPEKVQNDLEALTEYCPHAKSFLALLKYYRVRNVGSEKLLRAAAGYWDLSRDSDSSLLWEIVEQHFRVQGAEAGRKLSQFSPEFIEGVWSHAGAFDVKIGLRLAEFHFASRDADEAVRVLMRLIENADPNAHAVVASLRMLISRDHLNVASDLIERFRPALLADAGFQTVCAQLIVRRRDSGGAKELVENKDFRPAKLQAEDPLLYVQLLSLSGQAEEATAALRNVLDHALVEGELTEKLMKVGAMCFELGQYDLLKDRAYQMLSKNHAEHLLEMLGHRFRHAGFEGRARP
jgi:hypothetical protein